MSLFGPPPTPEELAEYRKRQAEQRAKLERKNVAILPHLKEAQRSLREAHSLGCGGHRFHKTTEHLAILVELIELELVSPAE